MSEQNPFSTLFSSLADPAKLKEFASTPGETAQADTSDRATFAAKAKEQIMVEIALQAIKVLMLDKRGGGTEEDFDAERKLYTTSGMTDTESLEMLAAGHLFRVTQDATLMAVLRARGEALTRGGIDRLIEQRWQKAQAAAKPA